VPNYIARLTNKNQTTRSNAQQQCLQKSMAILACFGPAMKLRENVELTLLLCTTTKTVQAN
jgi:hypothetical protein